MVSWNKEDWQIEILKKDIEINHKILKVIWIEQILKRQLTSTRKLNKILEFIDYRNYIKTYDTKLNSHKEYIEWCWSRINRAEKMLKSADVILDKPSIIWIIDV